MREHAVTTARKLHPRRKEKVPRRPRWWRAVKSFLRRGGLEALNVFVNHDWLFWIVGAINRRVGLIESVFLVYPASEKYGLAYAFPRRLRKNRWSPWPAGLLWQNGKLGVMFSISATNDHFLDPQNLDNLRRVTERMERLRVLLAAKGKTFAGILPGVLHRNRIVDSSPEANLTAVAVCKAVELVKAKESLDPHTPVIVLGGRGFIGRRVVTLLDGSPVHSIDVADGQNQRDWPGHLSDQPAILLNITRNHALADYVDQLWPGTVVINEVYPEPSPELLQCLRRKDCPCYHVVGVKALALPPFPAAYRGAIPCCAAWNAPQMQVVVRRLN